MAAGKRTFGGLIDDGVKSGMRYILNNFFDGHKQDALDLFTGTYVLRKGALPESGFAMAIPACSDNSLPSSTVLRSATP